MKKHTYEQPLAETFELSIQNTILDGSPNDPNAVRSNSASSGFDPNNDLSEI